MVSVLLALIVSVHQFMIHPVSPAFVCPSPFELQTHRERRPVYVEGFIHQEGITPSVHASTLTSLTNGNVLAAWYGGSREGAVDVVIYGAEYNSAGKTWGAVRKIIDPEKTGKETGRFVQRLGNPVLCSDDQGGVGLFYVSISAGGWSYSSINFIRSCDGGTTWAPARRLVTSPVLNLGTLVKSAPLRFSDGSIGLPVYAEFIGKFGELLRVNRLGRVLDKRRISSGKRSIQPAVVPLGKKKAVALFRNCGEEEDRRILRTASYDGGESWCALSQLNLPSPDAAVALLPIGGKKLLLAFNNSSRGRYNLSLAISEDGGNQWRIIRVIENGSERERFSYPFLIEASDGLFHLTYTWNRRRIKHVYFNRAWIEEQIR